MLVVFSTGINEFVGACPGLGKLIEELVPLDYPGVGIKGIELFEAYIVAVFSSVSLVNAAISVVLITVASTSCNFLDPRTLLASLFF